MNEQPHRIEPSETQETYALDAASESPANVRQQAGPKGLPPSAGKPRPTWLRFLTEHWAHETETSIYLLVSLLDFFCTYLLLMTGPGFFESNPVAAWFLNHYGPVKGLLGFKLSLTLLVCGLAQLVSYAKPAYGRGILLFGTLLTGAVVVYSIRLLLKSV